MAGMGHISIWRAATLCSVMLCLLTGCRSNISGSYMASDQSTVCWLQLVRTPDNRLSGQITYATVTKDGQIQRNSVAVTGAVDGDNVTISGSKFLGFDTFTFSGVQHGNYLTLTGAEATPMTLRRATLAEYQSQEAALQAQSQKIIAAKLDEGERAKAFQHQRDFVAEVSALIGKMDTFERAADVHLGRFPNAERAYGAITDRMKTLVARQRQLAGNENAGVARGQLSVAVTQTSLQTDQLHNQGESLQSALEGNIQPLVNESANLEQQCGAATSGAPTPFTPEELQNVRNVCDRLNAAVGPFRAKFNAMSSGLAHLEDVYRQEERTQQTLIQESDRMD